MVLAQRAEAAASATPLVILVLCIVAGVGTVLLLPGRGEPALRKIGAGVLLAVLLAGIAILVKFMSPAGAAGGRGSMGGYFWVFSVIAVGSAMRVITHPRPVYAALYFVLTVLATAGLFILLWAEFMAVALVIIYAGAILVTYVFVIMLASQSIPSTSPLAGLAEHDAISREPLLASVVGFALMGVLLSVIFTRAQSPRAVQMPPATLAEHRASIYARRLGPTHSFAQHLFDNHLLNLELAGVILTVSVVGAIIIARRRVAGAPGDAEAQTVVMVPGTPVDDDPHSIPVHGTENPRQKVYPET
jgi:NADH-quinone oxidoreductase subunit J